MYSHPVQASYRTPTCGQKERGSKLGTNLPLPLKGRGNQTEQENSCLRSITVRQKSS